MLYVFFRLLSIVIFKVLFGLQVSGSQYIPKDGGFILASNHVSYLDPIVIGAVCPRRLNFMARHDLFFNSFFTWFISALGAFPVKRDSADLSALKEAMRRVKGGLGLLLFPEGTRQETGNFLGRPQAGISFLASRLNVPVIPVFVKGTEKAMPKGAKFITRVKIFVYFGKPVQIAKGLSYEEIARLIMKNIGYLS